MTLNKMGNSSSVPSTGWQGFAMPDMGHMFTAELHYDGLNHGLTFDVWYQNPYTSSWCDVGDSKVQAALLNATPNSEVPEPGTLVVFAFGVAVSATRGGGKRKRPDTGAANVSCSEQAGISRLFLYARIPLPN